MKKLIAGCIIALFAVGIAGAKDKKAVKTEIPQPEYFQVDPGKYLVIAGELINTQDNKQVWVYFLTQVDDLIQLKEKYYGNVIYVVKIEELYQVKSNVEKVKEQVEKMKFNGYEINKKK